MLFGKYVIVEKQDLEDREGAPVEVESPGVGPLEPYIQPGSPVVGGIKGWLAVSTDGDEALSPEPLPPAPAQPTGALGWLFLGIAVVLAPFFRGLVPDLTAGACGLATVRAGGAFGDCSPSAALSQAGRALGDRASSSESRTVAALALMLHKQVAHAGAAAEGSSS